MDSGASQTQVFSASTQNAFYWGGTLDVEEMRLLRKTLALTCAPHGIAETLASAHNHGINDGAITSSRPVRHGTRWPDHVIYRCPYMASCGTDSLTYPRTHTFPRARNSFNAASFIPGRENFHPVLSILWNFALDYCPVLPLSYFVSSTSDNHNANSGELFRPRSNAKLLWRGSFLRAIAKVHYTWRFQRRQWRHVSQYIAY